jgi:hypothetical protein
MPNIQSGMKVIGADGVYVGSVDGIAGRRIRFTKADSGGGANQGRTYYIDKGLVVEVDGWNVRLFVNAAAAISHEQER